MEAPRQISRGLWARSKAAPLRALGADTSYRRNNLFEDENDDEDEYEGLASHKSRCYINSACMEPRDWQENKSSPS